VVVVLLGQASAAFHAAAVPHVTCAEHGESIHLAVSGVAAVAREARQTLVAATAEAEGHAHEHCGLQAPRTTTTDAPARVGASLEPVPLCLPPCAHVTPTLRLLSLAPKTSPPRPPAA
jgi:hypothetical protein